MKKKKQGSSPTHESAESPSTQMVLPSSKRKELTKEEPLLTQRGQKKRRRDQEFDKVSYGRLSFRNSAYTDRIQGGRVPQEARYSHLYTEHT